MANDNKTQASSEGLMEILLLPFSPRFIVLTICAVVTALLIARQLVAELEGLASDIEYVVVPPLCPLVGSPYDFSRTDDHIERAVASTDAWLARGGLDQHGVIPHEAQPHGH